MLPDIYIMPFVGSHVTFLDRYVASVYWQIYCLSLADMKPYTEKSTALPWQICNLTIRNLLSCFGRYINLHTQADMLPDLYNAFCWKACDLSWQICCLGSLTDLLPCLGRYVNLHEQIGCLALVDSMLLFSGSDRYVVFLWQFWDLCLTRAFTVCFRKLRDLVPNIGSYDTLHCWSVDLHRQICYLALRYLLPCSGRYFKIHWQFWLLMTYADMLPYNDRYVALHKIDMLPYIGRYVVFHYHFISNTLTDLPVLMRIRWDHVYFFFLVS